MHVATMNTEKHGISIYLGYNKCNEIIDISTEKKNTKKKGTKFLRQQNQDKALMQDDWVFSLVSDERQRLTNIQSAFIWIYD